MKIPKSLKSYIKVYEDFFDQDFCKAVIEDISKSDWQTHRFYSSETNTYHSYENELSVAYCHTENTNQLQSKLWNGIQKYINGLKFEWYNGWNGYTGVRFNKYDVSTQMKMHCDHIHSMFDGVRKGVPILTILGSLNNNYKGGEFVMWEDEVIEIPAGSVIIFPSNFMYPHMVKPVTEGVRYSFVSWVW